MAKKYNIIGAGWFKENPRDGTQYVSAKAEEKTLKLFALLPNGEAVPITNFAMYSNDKKNHPKAPDVRFVFTTEEEE